MKKLWGRRLQPLLLTARLKYTATGLAPCWTLRLMSAVSILALMLMTATGRAQGNFASAQVIGGVWGSVTNDNSAVIRDTNCPSIAGLPPNAPLWYAWTAPQSGEVDLDTIGSVDDFYYLYPLNTVVAVFTGNSITGLSQVAANDNLYPISGQSALLAQVDLSASADYPSFYTAYYAMLYPMFNITFPPGVEPVYSYPSPYYGPSHLRFNAVAGTTYYIAVDTEAGGDTYYSSFSTGSVQLQWAFQSSGVFRFATEDFDPSSGLPLYQTSGTESQPLIGNGNVDVNSPVFTYYPYNAPGVLVTVTRVAGSSGRGTVC
jgi:hypothetical protein